MTNRGKKGSTSIKDTILGIIIILVLGAFFVGIIFVLNHFGMKMIENLSKIDAVVIVALITGAISLIVAITSKIIDFKNSRRAYLAQKRERPYEEFVSMVYKVQRNTKIPNSYTDEEMIKDIKEFSEALTLWGSKNVAEKWVNFRLNSNNDNNSQNTLYILEDILNEMRHDMGVKKLSKGTLLSFFVNDLKDKK